MAKKAAQSANLVSIPVPNFITGVSQQPPHLRLATSVDTMENCWPSVITGCGKRPPTEYLSSIGKEFKSTVAGTIIDKENDQLPIVVTIADGDLYVFDIEGNQKTVSFPDGKLYLDAIDPAYAFRFLNIADTTFVLNRERKVSIREFGEPNIDDYVPDGQVCSKTDLPDPNTISEGVVYLAYCESKYYRNTYFPAVQQLCRWDQLSGNQDTPLDNSPVVDTFAFDDGWPVGQKVWLKKTGSYQTSSTSWIWINGWWIPINNTHTHYYNYYIQYVKTLVNAASASFFKWVEKTKQELVSEILNDRWDPTNCASVYVAASAGNTYYSIYINGKLAAQFLTNTNVDAAHAMETTDVIAQNLCKSLSTNGYTWIRTGSTITITNFPADGLILTTSSQGDTLMKCCYNMVRQFSDLPPQSPHGRMIVVGGDIDTGSDDYTVAYDAKTRQWRETYWYGRGAMPDNTTMPWVLIRNGNGTYTFKKHYWRSRPAGDQDSNPHPRFFNETLNDMFLYAGRLGFLTNSNIIFSGASHFEQFYRSTVATLQDDDRLDLMVATQNDDSMRHAIPYSRDLLILADKSQYRFQYQQFLGPKNVQISFTTSFNTSKHVAPVNMGASVFFADDSRSYRNAKVYEYFPRPQSQGDDAQEITEPVPAYLPNKLNFMSSSPRTNMLFCGSSNEPKSLFVYKYLWAGDKKVQSAWSKWTFPNADMVYWSKVNRNFLYVLIGRGNDTYLERIRIDERVEQANVAPDVFLDMRVEGSKIKISYNATDKHTYYIFPYKLRSTPKIVVSQIAIPTRAVTLPPQNNDNKKGVISQELEALLVDDSTIKVKGDYSGYFMNGGIPYTSSFTVSAPLVRTAAGTGVTAVLDGRLMVRWFNLEYHKAIAFKIRVNKRGYGEEVIYHETGRIDDPAAHMDQSMFERGTIKAPVMGNNLDTTITIENDSPHDAVFSSGEWWAIYQPKTRRIS